MGLYILGGIINISPLFVKSFVSICMSWMSVPNEILRGAWHKCNAIPVFIEMLDEVKILPAKIKYSGRTIEILCG